LSEQYYLHINLFSTLLNLCGVEGFYEVTYGIQGGPKSDNPVLVLR